MKTPQLFGRYVFKTGTVTTKHIKSPVQLPTIIALPGPMVKLNHQPF